MEDYHRIQPLSTFVTTSFHLVVVVLFAISCSAWAASSGQDMPVGNIVSGGNKWIQIFADDFDTDVSIGGFPGTAYGKTWTAYGPGWPDTSHNGVYDASKVISVHDSLMDMFIHTDTSTGIHYVSAPCPAVPYGQTYGRYTARMKSDPLRQYKVAWLLWPDSEVWPADGEIDFPEGNLNETIGAFMHYADPNGGQSAFSSHANFTVWHTFTTEWSPGKVIFYLDGGVLGTATHEVPYHPMHYVLQTETALSGGPPAATTQGHVLVDWVSVYTYGGPANSLDSQKIIVA
jgi:hypothetical protein